LANRLLTMQHSELWGQRRLAAVATAYAMIFRPHQARSEATTQVAGRKAPKICGRFNRAGSTLRFLDVET
jgi:hypothetical protein